MEAAKAIDCLENITVKNCNEIGGGVDRRGDQWRRQRHHGAVPCPVLYHLGDHPHIVVDEFEKRFFNLKGYYYNYDIVFSHSTPSPSQSSSRR